MSDENNSYQNNSGNPQYIQAPPENQNSNNYNNYGGYGGGPVNDYSSGKGQGKGLGIASMVCGILSIVTVCCLGALYSGYGTIPIILGIVGVVLGIVQIVKNESRGMAIAGIVCGAIGVVFAVISLIAILALGSIAGSMDSETIMQWIQNEMVIRL